MSELVIDSKPWLDHPEEPKKCNSKSIILISIFTIVILASIAAMVTAIVLVNKTAECEFVYFNDIHIDPRYDPYSDVSKDKEGWCRRPFNGTEKPFKFGQYGCDPPQLTIESAIASMPQVAKNPSFVLFGGDAPGHDLGLDRPGVQNIVNWTITEAKKAFPGIPILMTIGNNDFQVDYGQTETDPLDFASIAEVLREFMNDEQYNTFLKGGYYYHDIPEAKLRLLLLNTVLYSTSRPEADDDPRGQFEWIRTVSTDAKSKGMSVGAAMHIPPGVSHWSMSQGWYDKYVITFDTLVKELDIKFTMTGHNHNDMLMPVYGNSGASLGYALTSPALSPVHSNNPGFRIVKLGNGEITDIAQYYAEMMMNPENLKWELEYEFTKAYNVKDLSRNSLLQTVDWISHTGEGKWCYREKIGARADDHGSFYYCILQATTVEQVKECMKGLNSLKGLTPYDGR